MLISVKLLTKYRNSSNNSRPSMNRLPRIIAPPDPTPLIIFSFFYPPPPPTRRQVEVESDPAKLIGDDSSSEN